MRWAREAEDAGFDAVMISEHVVLGPDAGDRGVDGWDWHRPTLTAWFRRRVVAGRMANNFTAAQQISSLSPVAEEVTRKSNDAFVGLIHDPSDNEKFRRSSLGPAPRHLALIILGGLNELTADLVESGGDLRLGAEIATATTTALLATDFVSRGNPPGRERR